MRMNAAPPVAMPAICAVDSIGGGGTACPEAVYTRSELMDQYASVNACGLFITNDVHDPGHPDEVYVAAELRLSIHAWTH